MDSPYSRQVCTEQGLALGREGTGREGKGREEKGREGKGREGKGRAPDSSGRDTVDFCSTAVRPVWKP